MAFLGNGISLCSQFSVSSCTGELSDLNSEAAKEYLLLQVFQILVYHRKPHYDQFETQVQVSETSSSIPQQQATGNIVMTPEEEEGEREG